MNVTTLAGLLIAVISFSLVVLSRVQLGESFSVNPQARKLVSHGLYSRIQNPMYVFVDLTLGGISLATHRWYVLLVLVVVLPVQIRNVIKERGVLSEKFGEPYAAYRRSTWF